MKYKRVFLSLSIFLAFFSLITSQWYLKADEYAQILAGALVLINSASPSASDFAKYIQPYLDYFGIPYLILDISKTEVTSDISRYSLIIVGHKNLDPAHVYLTNIEEEYIKNAVTNGTGLVNFDSVLFKTEIPVNNEVIRLNCWENEHQDPVLSTFTNPALLNLRDNRWDEFEWSQRGYPGVFGGPKETLPMMKFYVAVPNGTYKMVANLYHTNSYRNVLRYYYGFQPDNPREKYFDVSSGSDFVEYDLGSINVTNGVFAVYVDHADLISGPEYFFGWAWIKLIRETPPENDKQIYQYAKDIFNFTSKGTVNVNSIEIRNPNAKPPVNKTDWLEYSNELLINPSGDGGTNGWTAIGSNKQNFAAGFKPAAGYVGPHSGNNAFYWNLPSSREDWAYQDVDLTPWQPWVQNGTAQLSFSAWLVCSEYHNPPWDIVRTRLLFYSTSGRETLAYDSGEQGLLTTWTKFGVADYNITTDAVKVRVMFQTYENYWDAGSADDFSLRIRVANVTTASEQPKEAYITSLHPDGEAISLRTSITLPFFEISNDSQIPVTMNQYPFLITKNYGSGRAVQWASYDFLDWNVLGYFKGLDDIFWRSIVWAARKPFVMQGMPPFVTMRIDDCNGPYDYIDNMNGFVPVLAAFKESGLKNQLAAYVNSGKAICAIHERTVNDWGNIDTEAEANAFWAVTDAFFYNNGNSFPMAKSWHPHFYETGVALASGMRTRGIEFLSNEIDFGMSFGNQFSYKAGPYMEYQHPPSGSCSYIIADWSNVYPDFFNVFSNPHGYYSELPADWLEVGGGITGITQEAIRRIKRSLDSMTFACFFTHEYNIDSIGYTNFGTITANIVSHISSYNPIYTDFDTIARYVRAVVGTSVISAAVCDTTSNTLYVTLTGKADVATKFYLFTEENGQIRHVLVDVPSFVDNVTVIQQL